MSDGARCHYCRKVPCICAEPTKISSAEELQALQADNKTILDGIFDHRPGCKAPDYGECTCRYIQEAIDYVGSLKAQVKALKADRDALREALIFAKADLVAAFLECDDPSAYWLAKANDIIKDIDVAIDAAIQQSQTKEGTP